ncbi:MAG: DNA transposition protein [Rhodospirillales bacterium]|nr:DNA transposition protein [Rhodospirillales bacterium]
MKPEPRQLDLLGWTPPQPVARFDTRSVRARTLQARMCQAISAALREASVPRQVIAERMSEYLGQTIGVNMLNAYASQAREDHVISLPRFLALVHATGDRRLMQAAADLFGWAVIESRYLPMIELAAVSEQQRALARRARVLSLQARREGGRAC